MKIFGGEVVHGHRTVSSVKIGVAVIIVSLVVGWASFNKIMVKQWFTPSETIKVNFASNNVIVPYYSKVKVNFVPVGLVTGLEKADDGSALVTLQVDRDIPGKLGTEPSATVRPTTLLGGNYFVDLKPGGAPGEFTGTIPKERTTLPVELDKVLRSFQPDAQVGLRGFVKKFDETLAGGGTQALQRLVHDAPGSLKPTGEVLDALRGTRPQSDLTDFVRGFETTSRALTDKPGQLSAVARDLANTATSFGTESAAVSSAINQLPDALASADRGLIRLDVTLDILRDTAKDIRPSAKELGDTLDELEPTLDDARPTVKELRDLLDDARPAIADLVPVTDDLTDVLDNIGGEPTHRVNGPIKDLVMNPYQGTGPYAQTKSDKTVFQELGSMVANLDRATLMDRNGGGIAFQANLLGIEGFENLLANNGQPRFETLQRTLLDPQRIKPPIELPKVAQPPHPGNESGGGKQNPLQLPKLPSLGGN